MGPWGKHYDVFEYATTTCGRCEPVFFVESEFYDIASELYPPQGEQVFYPSPHKMSMEGIPATARRAYSDATDAFKAGLYDLCVIMSRKCLEAVCQELGARKGSLKQRLSEFRDQGTIDKKLFEWADELRLIGNDAVHELEIGTKQVDAEDALDFVEAILMYVFTLNKRFEEFQKRRAAHTNSNKSS